MDELETKIEMLRKHGVCEFSQDQFGIRVKFAEDVRKLFPLAPLPLVRTLAHDGPPDSALEVEHGDINDILFGAK